MIHSQPAVILVLGAPNDETGRLSPRAVERGDRAWEEYTAHPDYRLMTTGGWGSHFNTAPRPHGWYSRQYLIAKGVPEAAFLPVAESRHTVEDAVLSRPILVAAGARDLHIVTSDFHVPRARFCFEREFPDFTLIFCPALTRDTEEEMRRLRAHEARALARLKGE